MTRSSASSREDIAPDSGFARLMALRADHVRCPFPAYADLREGHPVAWSGILNAYVVSRYTDIREVLKDPATFSSIKASGASSVTSLAEHVMGEPQFSDEVRRQATRRLRLSQSPVLLSQSPVLLTSDPPMHKRQRALVNHAFTPRRVAAMEPLFQEITDDLIDGFVRNGEAELIADFALPLPMTVIATILGVPPSMVHTFKRWSGAFTRGVGALDLPDEEISDLFLAVGEFYDYFIEQLETRRAAPSDDLLSVLLAARIDDEQPLTQDEILQMLVQFLIGGNETTTNLIGGIMCHLLRDPALIAEIEANPSLVAALVEEGLRLESPTQGMFRTATTDCEVGGRRIAAGSMLS